MIEAVGGRLLRLAWSLPFAAVLPPRRPVVVMYHGVPAAGDAKHCGRVFEQHILFLKRHFEFVSPHDAAGRPEPSGKRQVLLTLDDGFRNNAEVVAPILRKYRVPAVFFVSSRHATPGKYLWFSYLQGLEEHFPANGFSFGDSFFDMAPAKRQRSVERLRKVLLALRPHPAAMYKAIEDELPRLEDFVSAQELADSYAGMTVEQVAELAADPLFSIGAHTLDHPFLTMCERDEARRQIIGNRGWIAATCGRSCDAIAYPSGDYNSDVVTMCRQAGFTHGYAIVSRINRKSELERSRIGIYAESTDVLGFKVRWGTLLRAAGVSIG